MRKSLIAIIVILVVAVAAGVFYVFSNLDAIVKAAIEQYGSDAVQTSVRVDKVAIKLTEGTAAIQGVSVANPEGFSLPLAFALGEIAVDIDLEKTGKELIAIDAINIAAPRIFYEINAQRQGSLNVLKENLASTAASSSGASAEGESPAAADSAPVNLAIARFELKQASLHAKVVPLDNKTYDLKLPALVLSDLSGTPEQISRQVLDRLIDHAKQEIKKQGLDKELAEIKARAQQRIDEEKAKLEQMTDEQIEEKKQEVEDRLKNLLNR